MKICVLGSKHKNVDLSLNWSDEIPYLANYDILIINTKTLEEMYFKKTAQKFESLKENIFNMLMAENKKIIVIYGGITSFLPVSPIFGVIKDAELLPCEIEGYFVDYVKNIIHSNLYINDFYASEFFNFAKRLSTQSYSFADDIKRYRYNQKNIIKNKGNLLVGTSMRIKLLGERGLYDIKELYYLHDSGEITFLPPPTNISISEGIELLIQNFSGLEIKEIEPDWIDKVELPNLVDIENNIYKISETIQKEREEITILEKRRSELTYFRTLLWTKGPILEKAVIDSLKFLGFNELKRIRGEELEDGVFKFKIKCKYELGILEIKGSDNRTSLANLTQCNKWVEDYLLDQKMGKGIFITNQYRLRELSTSITDRTHFEPNELEYAETRKICIIPSYEIFNAVVLKLKGDTTISREKIEEKIIASDGLFKLI